MIPIRDPRLIPQSEMPFIVLSNQKNSWIGKAIDFRTDISDPGMFPVDHAMISINQGKFVSQEPFGYKEEPMDSYLVPGGQLWFVYLVNSNPAFVSSFRASVLKRLALPAWLKTYDFLGIAGQALGIPWLHTPFLDYCSVDCISHLKAACGNLPLLDAMVIRKIPNESNPEYLTEVIVENPQCFNIKYSWQYGTEV